MADDVPVWHRNPRLQRFSLRLPDQGLPMVALLEWFYEHPAPLHRHNLTQVLILVEGELRLGFEDADSWEVRPGEGVLIPAGIMHQPGPTQDDRHALILDVRLSAHPANSLERWLNSERSLRRWRCDPSTLAASITQFGSLASAHRRIDLARLMHATWGLFVAADAETGEVAPEPPERPDDAGIDKRVLYVESIMRREFEQPYDAEHLAHSIQVSVGQMNRLFKLHRGTTPLRHLQAIRLEQARQYLANSNLSVQQIAERCGFVNPVHFTKLFKDAYSQTPRDYRATLPG